MNAKCTIKVVNNALDRLLNYEITAEEYLKIVDESTAETNVSTTSTEHTDK